LPAGRPNFAPAAILTHHENLLRGCGASGFPKEALANFGRRTQNLERLAQRTTRYINNAYSQALGSLISQKPDVNRLGFIA